MNSFHASTPPTFRNIAKLKLQGNFVKKGLSYFPLIGGGGGSDFQNCQCRVLGSGMSACFGRFIQLFLGYALLMQF